MEKSGLPETSVYAQDFCEMVREWYAPSGLSFSLAELEVHDVFSKDAANSMQKILCLIQDVYEQLRRTYAMETYFNVQWWNDGERGFFVKAGNLHVLYFGLWMRHWQDRGNPLCFGVRRDWNPKIVELFRKTFPKNELYSPEKFSNYLYLVSVEERLLMASDAVEAVVRMLDEGYLKNAVLLAQDSTE